MVLSRSWKKEAGSGQNQALTGDYESKENNKIINPAVTAISAVSIVLSKTLLGSLFKPLFLGVMVEFMGLNVQIAVHWRW